MNLSKVVNVFEEIRDEFEDDTNVYRYKAVKDRTNELMNILTDRDGLTKEDQQKRKKEIKALGRYLHQLTTENTEMIHQYIENVPIKATSVSHPIHTSPDIYSICEVLCGSICIVPTYSLSCVNSINCVLAFCRQTVSSTAICVYHVHEYRL